MTTSVATHHGFAAASRTSSHLAHVGPSWFGTVMGTGIVANAAATLPIRATVLDQAARALWVLACVLLVVVAAATVAHWLTHPGAARGHLDDPVMSHFHGAPAMALMTVGAGALLVGQDVIGARAAITLDAVLWTTGTALGLWTLWTIPRRTLRRALPYAGPAFGGWLMPVVPPMVSAATGALLVPHLPGGLRPAMVGALYAMAAIALVASAPILVLVVRRAVRGRVGAATTVPTLFIVLGPLGQSVTATHVLGDLAGAGWTAFGIAYGLPVLALAAVWLVVAATITVRTARTGLPFALTWWSFTFPIGTVVTGASGLGAATGWTAVDAAAVVLFAVLVVAWVVVAARTVRGVWTADLLRPPPPATPDTTDGRSRA